MTFTTRQDSSEGGLLDAFRSRYAQDRADRRVRSLSDYLDLFPGDDVAIAREFAILEAEATQPCLPAAEVSGALGPYRLLREIGRGGQGIVYDAFDTRLRRPVAIKVLKERGWLPPREVARFTQEAQVVSRLHHPGLCSVFDAGVVDGTPYIVMQRVEGRPLTEHLALARAEPTSKNCVDLPTSADPPDRPASGATDGMPVMRAARLVEDAARALQTAHAAGIVHRDVKPGKRDCLRARPVISCSARVV